MTPVLEMPLEERDEALASVDALLDGARAGRGRLLVLEGPAGIGKTRLLTAIHERAEAAGMRTLCARGGELEQDFPFGIVRQLFEGPLAGPSHSELLSGPAELARPPSDLADTGELPAADPAYSTLHGLYWLTVNFLETGPVLLSVDDLHWCDPASLRYLAYLVRRLDGLGLLVLATMRPRASAEPGVIDEITDSLDAMVLRLSPLSGDGVAAVLSAHFGTDPDPEFSSTVSEWTAGNPLLLRELIAAAVARRIEATSAGAQRVRGLAPEGVGRLVLRRIAPLGAHSLAVAEARRRPRRRRRDRPDGRAGRPHQGRRGAHPTRPRRAHRHRRSPPPRRPHRRRRAHRHRAPRRPHGRRRADEPRSRPSALRHPQDRRGPPLPHLLQARPQVPLTALGSTAGPMSLSPRQGGISMSPCDSPAAALADAALMRDPRFQRRLGEIQLERTRWVSSRR